MEENVAQDGKIHICAAGDDHNIVDVEICHHHNMNKTWNPPPIPGLHRFQERGRLARSRDLRLRSTFLCVNVCLYIYIY
jgi:hypothetical protein